MAKRKTAKVKDLRPEKISEEQLGKLQHAIKSVSTLQAEIGGIEMRKHEALHSMMNWQGFLRELQKEFKEAYGTDDVNVLDGTIKYNDNEQADKKDNDREGL